MRTDELISHLARALGIPEDELQSHADKLKEAGLRDDWQSIGEAVH